MSTFSVPMEIGDSTGTRFEKVDAFVDSGSTFTSVPRELLERLGIRPRRTVRVRLADGRVTEKDAGEALIRLQGLEGTSPVIFNEPGESVLLGAVTLESFLLGVDPVEQRLIPVEGLRLTSMETSD